LCGSPKREDKEARGIKKKGGMLSVARSPAFSQSEKIAELRKEKRRGRSLFTKRNDLQKRGFPAHWGERKKAGAAWLHLVWGPPRKEKPSSRQEGEEGQRKRGKIAASRAADSSPPFMRVRILVGGRKGAGRKKERERARRKVETEE